MSDKVYNSVRALVELGLPATATLYFTLAQIWGLPNAEQVVGTITAIVVFLGVLLRVARNSYNTEKYQGRINVVETDEKLTYSLELDTDPNELQNKGEVTFKVVRP
jgi:hypothetical protein